MYRAGAPRGGGGRGGRGGGRGGFSGRGGGGGFRGGGGIDNKNLIHFFRHFLT